MLEGKSNSVAIILVIFVLTFLSTPLAVCWGVIGVISFIGFVLDYRYELEANETFSNWHYLFGVFAFYALWPIFMTTLASENR